jgi:hypothetical protein
MSIEITEVRNAQYITPDGYIDMEINHPEYGWIEYTLGPDDPDTTIDNAVLMSLAEALPNGILPLDQSAWDERVGTFIRMNREAILREIVDPLVTNPLRWEELTPEKQQEWRDFRRALLDITDQEGYPHNVVWPTQPE